MLSCAFFSAADLYIEGYLHQYVCSAQRNVKLVRLYYKNRWCSTVSNVLLKYALMDSSRRSFRDPTFEDIADADVVVTTLTTAYSLLQLNLPCGEIVVHRFLLCLINKNMLLICCTAEFLFYIRVYVCMYMRVCAYSL